MAKYIVKSGQSLYDIALRIYGSVEGIVDLMMNNTELSLCDNLKIGDVLNYTDDYIISPDIVAYFERQGIVPANAERHVYIKEPRFPLVFELLYAKTENAISIELSGSGTIEIDWGDNTKLEFINLNKTAICLPHSFDNQLSGNRRVRLYGDFELHNLDLIAANPNAVFIYKPVIIEKLRLKDSKSALDFLLLTEQLLELNLTGLISDNLNPLTSCKELMRLDLRGLNAQKSVLDTYLIRLVNDYENRRNCEIFLSTKPGGEYREPDKDENGNYTPDNGMEAIWVLTNEIAWNEGGRWKFNINDEIYTLQV